MTASEFSFMALGLVLGLVSGAAIIEFVRARPPAPREVRLTVSHDAIPRRSSTLTDDAFTAVGPEPARGGPADRRLIGSPLPVGAADRRTTVRFAPAAPAAAPGASVPPSIPGAIPIARDPSPPLPGRVMEPALPPSGTSTTGTDEASGRMVGIPISSGEDPVMSAIRERGATVAPAVVPLTPTVGRIESFPESAPAAAGASAAVALLDPPMAIRRRSGDEASDPLSAAAAAPPADPASPPVAGERCAEERRIAAERCELASRARAQAEAASDALSLAQRAYDAHEAAAVTASWGADPRAIHDAKDAAQGGFRAAVQAAATSDALEIAARDWLNEINRINTDAREATATASREHAAAAEIGATLERLGLEADAARIGAENADAACLAARMAVADCDELNATDVAPAKVTAQANEPWTPRLDEDETLGRDFGEGLTPRIFRLLRGDRKAMTALVATLADGDADARRRWQLQRRCWCSPGPRGRRTRPAATSRTRSSRSARPGSTPRT